MSNVFFSMFLPNKLSEGVKGRESSSQRSPYNQEIFRYLLESESKRSKRSGRLCQVILVHWAGRQGRGVGMDTHVAMTVMAALSHSLRETDYIGWYRDNRIIGAVLTVLEQESMAQVTSHFQKRLVEVLQSKLSIEESRRLQIRACLPHELEGAEA